MAAQKHRKRVRNHNSNSNQSREKDLILFHGKDGMNGKNGHEKNNTGGYGKSRLKFKTHGLERKELRRRIGERPERDTDSHRDREREREYTPFCRNSNSNSNSNNRDNNTDADGDDENDDLIVKKQYVSKPKPPVLNLTKSTLKGPSKTTSPISSNIPSDPSPVSNSPNIPSGPSPISPVPSGPSNLRLRRYNKIPNNNKDDENRIRLIGAVSSDKVNVKDNENEKGGEENVRLDDHNKSGDPIESS
ncbi:unnamed protein product [Ambrosiozyma monospora]|uniref:Unnamed protein product n=1 Tax=Ambrosiozyma monospora TaxID=43982 RepID=A0ACB5T9C7_AMBMO|nr:unnamed protein product [Ambrosiozyma monospora]